RQAIKTWVVKDSQTRNGLADVVKLHVNNLCEAVRAGDPGLLNAPILEGHLSSALCHTGGISQRLGRPATAREIAVEIDGSSLLSEAFDRMAAHLRRNGVDVDNIPSLKLGPWLKL